MITLVDYGLGNIQAFANVYKRLNIDVTFARSADELRNATHIILPGVGAFDHAMQRLEQSGMRTALDELVLDKRVPVVGVCVGMQMLADSSEEGSLPGLGWIKGRVKNFRTAMAGQEIPLPHMGWNDVEPVRDCRLFKGLETDSRFYFLHSYFFECEQERDTAAVSSYGFQFACAVAHENINGVQFHPEKSHQFGTMLLKNFSEL
jgi:glutamine amidotransferase